MAAGVLVDANILFSRTLRDWLFLLKLRSQGSIFRVYATEDIVAEVVYRTRRKKPDLSGEYIANLHDRICGCLDDRVVAYKTDDSFPGLDKDDAHVHGAAVAAKADYLLTCDTGWLDLPEEELDSLPYEVHHPDSFFICIDDFFPQVVRDVTEEQARYWFKQTGSADLPRALRKAGCDGFAERVRLHLQHISV